VIMRFSTLDENKITDTDPHRWWFNNDDDVDETSGNDVSGSGSADYSNAVVDSTRDLVDFFPERFKFSIYMACQRLMKIRKKRLEDAIDHFSSHNGRLAEPQTAC
tara:strand:+ start:991 stop:1305 length:315 start_codon:yes stop_codon:yes gene_type:complete